MLQSCMPEHTGSWLLVSQHLYSHSSLPVRTAKVVARAMAIRRPRPAATSLNGTQGVGTCDNGNGGTRAYDTDTLELDLEGQGLRPLTVSWGRRQGDRVKVGAELAQVICERLDGGGKVVRRLKAQHTGRLEEVVVPDLSGLRRPGTDVGREGPEAKEPEERPLPPPRLVLGKLRYCTHPVLQSGRMCAVCGEVLSEGTGQAQEATRVFVQGGYHVSVSRTEAAFLHRSMAQKLRRARKLNLILDIDLTLLHATIDPRAERLDHQKLEVHAFDIFNQGRILRHWCCLRPHLRTFLSQAHALYVLTIYTHGRRDYAHQVARLLDPDRTLFEDRIVSRDDCPDLHGQKSLQRLFPGGIEMALILDDSPQVWQGEQSRHLLPVLPFKFYTEFEEVNRVAGLAPAPVLGSSAVPPSRPLSPPPSSPPTTTHSSPAPSGVSGKETDAEADRKEEKTPPVPPTVFGDPREDTQLEHTWRALEAVHALYYPGGGKPDTEEGDGGAGRSIIQDRGPASGNDELSVKAGKEGEGEEADEDQGVRPPQNVAGCLSFVRRQVLAGVTILFSGVLPRNVDPRRSDLGYMALSLGARIVEDFSPTVTHLVAENASTEKVFRARRQGGVWIVARTWLQLSFLHCDRKDEAGHVLPGCMSTVVPSGKKGVKETLPVSGGDGCEPSGEPQEAKEQRFDNKSDEDNERMSKRQKGAAEKMEHADGDGEDSTAEDLVAALEDELG
ncbi:hypothetical protein NSK_000226 [Nannochloropsis salina CCMP1776]|uniref:protein-serine/threonine phosphatase n=1 Tax=Nannochloropsis salina CCMP1776 TaxID=1027361 RepID=A0A4D9DDY4_9STRA|nr:hypothetical protein NSK_000226 [Nannochloropsis salina CCMP1776]|eukprot:TFJ88657.1 hypothetical protein NSK_000226 [Nannochloropsis salina CCMP1776]